MFIKNVGDAAFCLVIYLLISSAFANIIYQFTGSILHFCITVFIGVIFGIGSSYYEIVKLFREPVRKRRSLRAFIKEYGYRK